VIKRILVLTLTTLTTGAALASSPAHADRSVASAAPKQPVVRGFYRGATVRYFDFGPIKLQPGNKLVPIWTFKNGSAGQHNVIDTVPGLSTYSPLWQVNEVTWVKGKKPRTLRSAAAIRSAAAAGEVRIIKTKTIVNCPVLGFGQAQVTGFSAGHTIHYYDLGPVKVAAGNTVVPLYDVTNGVAGQHNIAGDTIAQGQTAYPPLWAIKKVTWSRGATPRLLTSFAAIQSAAKAEELTITNTPLVVNCPLI